MSRIRILPEILSNQIAAGEVVQRPASVVKELVENSMDAGADRISVEIERGGRSLIRVSDNGSGLARDEAMLAIERYATSKMFAQEDLFSISTFGFRGEALPSIASVSKFTLVSRTRDNDLGTRIDINGGTLAKVSEAGAPPGTMVEVRRLFYNTPARRKFLKAEATEAGHISDAMSGLAMGNPDIGFRLFLNNRLVKNFPPGQNLFQRAQMVLGRDAIDQLYPLAYPLDGHKGDLRISGVCANPSVTRSTANRIYLFVNNRLVRDSGLISALFQGYRGRIMKGRYPMGVICVEIAFDQVDVNVHPTKREVKFLGPQPVYQALGHAVTHALTAAQADSLNYALSPPVNFTQIRPKSEPPTAPSGEKARNDYPAGLPAADQVAQNEDHWEVPEPGIPVPPGPACDLRAVSEPEIMPIDREGYSRIIGQILNTYIVVEKDRHLVLVDQHAAHERIVYEQLKARHDRLDVQSQALMVPEVVELTHKEAVVLAPILDELAGLGLDIEPFGGTSFVIKAVPVLVEEKQVKQMIVEMVEQRSCDNETYDKDGWLDACLTTMACHRAIRANKSMTLAEMEQLMADLGECENPMHCPHGRPIMISFDQRRLEKLFKRLV